MIVTTLIIIKRKNLNGLKTYFEEVSYMSSKNENAVLDVMDFEDKEVYWDELEQSLET